MLRACYYSNIYSFMIIRPIQSHAPSSSQHVKQVDNLIDESQDKI